jgi:hypothetical protein
MNEIAKQAFADFSSPWKLYRMVYKATACGPSIGISIPGKYLYCDALPNSWDEHPISSFLISSIVEGVDETTETLEVSTETTPAKLEEAFFIAVEEINKQACEIWDRTHGCDTCAEHFHIDLNEDHSPVWKNCPECEGYGIVF